MLFKQVPRDSSVNLLMLVRSFRMSEKLSIPESMTVQVFDHGSGSSAAGPHSGNHGSGS